MNRSSLLKSIGLFFLFCVLLMMIHRVNQSKQKEILAEVWINPSPNTTTPKAAKKLNYIVHFNEDSLFQSLMKHIIDKRDSQFIILIPIQQTSYIKEKIGHNPRFIVH
jgi:hypothetical protein